MAIKNYTNATLCLRNGLAAVWEQKNPILASGEPGLEIDTGLLKVGDGVTPYNELNYINVTPAYVSEELDKKVNKTGDIIQGILTLNYIPTLSTDAVNKGYVDNLILTAGLLKRSIVNELPPVAEADPNTIYMVKDVNAFGPDLYKEYMLVNEAFEQIGDTSVNLTNYIQKPNSVTAGNLVGFNADGSIYDTGISASNIMASVNVNDLIQDDGDVLILNCGTPFTVL